MARRTVPLTLDRLAALGEAGTPCRTCTRWELDPVRRGRLTDPLQGAAEKDAWVSELLRDWGSCGRVAMVDDAPVGLAVYAPAALVPGAAEHPTAPATPDAVLLTTLRVDPAHAGGGLGRMLVQAMAADLIGRGGIRAVEAFASTQGDLPCLVPAEFLGRVGFRTHRPHPRVPRMRMDLRTALTWRDEVEAAVERLLGAVRPRPVPVLPETREGPRPAGAVRGTGPAPTGPSAWCGAGRLRPR